MSASAVSKNPFDLLHVDGEEDEEGSVPVKKDARDVNVVKKAPTASSNVPAKGTVSAPSDTAAASSASKDAGKSQGRPPRREYERQGGTGRGRRSDGAEDKRGGKYNWGSKEPGNTPGDGATADPRVLTEEEKAAAEAADEARRKEEQQMTLDEYLKQKAEKAEEEKVEIRKVEAVDMKGLKIKEAAAEDVWTIGDEDDKNKGSKGKKSGRKATAFTDVNFTTTPIETSGPAGRGRGRGRGGGGGGDRDYRDRRPVGGGGGGRGGPADAPSVALADDAAFPSLGCK